MQLQRIPGKSDLAGAIRDARWRWSALGRYLDDGRLELSNNAAENAIRPVALGRKNWLFAGSDWGGERAALFETLRSNEPRLTASSPRHTCATSSPASARTWWTAFTRCGRGTLRATGDVQRRCLSRPLSSRKCRSRAGTLTLVPWRTLVNFVR